MSIDAKEIAELALLARLHLEPDEALRLQTELSAVLDHFAVLASVETADVVPMTHAIPIELRLRNDVVAASLPTQEAMKGAPKRDGDLFVVPAVIPGAK
jgi:aspartyl-tRNA(Asn)/glutamyl-tRNA(Gln) amidotransferase subunit C